MLMETNLQGLDKLLFYSTNTAVEYVKSQTSVAAPFSNKQLYYCDRIVSLLNFA